MSLLELYCAVDDFCKRVAEGQAGHLLPSGTGQRERGGQLSDSEALTIMIHFHQSQYRTFNVYSMSGLIPRGLPRDCEFFLDTP